jgi:signal transduction histidine kinase
LPPGEHTQVFRRFYRAEAARHTAGNGLGLSLVAAIAKLHNATVSVDTSEAGGCRFVLTFPGPAVASERTPIAATV